MSNRVSTRVHGLTMRGPGSALVMLKGMSGVPYLGQANLTCERQQGTYYESRQKVTIGAGIGTMHFFVQGQILVGGHKCL